jgi:hypothetical protein
MNNLLQNQVGIDLMIWESNPKKRNTNNEVKMVAPINQEIKVGDVLVGLYSPEKINCYQITEIVSRKPSSLGGKDYLIVRTKWSAKIPDFTIFKLLTDKRFNNLYNLN